MAINQALGRAIRHAKDWESVYLMDSRCGEKKCQSGLPSWVVPKLNMYGTYELSPEAFKTFVKINSKENKNNT